MKIFLIIIVNIGVLQILGMARKGEISAVRLEFAIRESRIPKSG